MRHVKKRVRYVTWVMMAAQMAAWAWMQANGGRLGDGQYLLFCGMMMTGQVGAAIECVAGKAWGTLVVQIYFFIFTLVGGLVRFQHMR